MAAAPLAILTDRQERALAAKRFAAWWDGRTFDAEAVRAELSQIGPAAKLLPAPAHLSPAAQARAAALEAAWGKAAGAPFTACELEGLLGEIGTGLEITLGLIGTGTGPALEAIKVRHMGPVQVFEASAVVLAQLRARADEDTSFSSIDVSHPQLPDDEFDGLLVLDELMHAGDPRGFARAAMASVKPGGRIALAAYVATPGRDMDPSFASDPMQVHLRDDFEVIDEFRAAGLTPMREIDISADFQREAKAAFAALPDRLPELVRSGNVRAMQEVLWEVETWKWRLRALAAHRLKRMVFLFERPDPA